MIFPFAMWSSPILDPDVKDLAFQYSSITEKNQTINNVVAARQNRFNFEWNRRSLLSPNMSPQTGWIDKWSDHFSKVAAAEASFPSYAVHAKFIVWNNDSFVKLIKRNNISFWNGATTTASKGRLL